MRTLLLVLATSAVAAAVNNGLGQTPQTGFNTWNAFHCAINETKVRANVDSFVSAGLGKLYEYFNIDDCWCGSRDAQGNPIPDEKTFPSGMKSLADYVHSKGLKFGLYSDSGNKTCAGRPGSLGYETQDANSYAEWGVDYLKYDNCFNDKLPPRQRYPVMRDALNRTGRPIFYSLCEWGNDNPGTWAPAVGNSWRTTGDIQPVWSIIMNRLDTNEALYLYAGPGGWNDPDMLEVGNGLGLEKDKSHFTLWAAMKAPLLIGTPLTSVTQEVLQVFLNEEVVAINQDPLGVQARRVASEGWILDGLSVPHSGHRASEAGLRAMAALNATNLVATPCVAGAAYQQWAFNANGSVTTGADGRCIDIDECQSSDDGDNVSVYPCETSGTCGGRNQLWKATSQGRIVSAYDGQCLTAGEMPLSNYHTHNITYDVALSHQLGYNVITEPCYNLTDGSVPPGQRWTAQHDGSVHSGVGSTSAPMCLGVFQDVPRGAREVWSGPLSGGAKVVILFNRGVAPSEITAHWSDLGLQPTDSMTARDLWQHKDIGTVSGSISDVVPSHGVVAYKLSPA